MIDEETIEKLIQPMVERQQGIELYIINKIAERIKKIEGLLPSDLYSLEQLFRSGADIQEINKKIAELTQLQVKDIKKMIQLCAYDSYDAVQPFYDYRHISYIPFNQNKYLQKEIEAITRQTSQTYINLSKAQAFMLRDSANPQILKPTTIAKTYQQCIDKAVQASQLGVIDYQTATRSTLEELIDSGLQSVQYNTTTGRSYKQRLDTAVRRNILDGIRAINQKVQDITGEEFNADGKEITVHLNPAEDHAECQGHQFTNEEVDKIQNGEDFEDVNGRKFQGFDRAIGTLNCRHFTWSIIIGVSTPLYTQKQLDEILKKNEEGYTTPEGRHLTMYECTQKQRAYELKLRKAKEGKEVAKTAGNTKLLEKYQKRIKALNQEYLAFSTACGLKPRFDKTRIIT